MTIFCKDCKFYDEKADYSPRCAHPSSLKKSSLKPDEDYYVTGIDKNAAKVGEHYYCATARNSQEGKLCGIKGKFFEAKEYFVVSEPTESKKGMFATMIDKTKSTLGII
jgi:hypothetical protein